MNRYSTAYPPLDPPQDARARLQLEPFAARGVAAGAPLNIALLVEAKREHDLRYATVGYGITEIEALLAELRLHAIEAEHIGALYYGGQNGRIGAAAVEHQVDRFDPIFNQLQAINNAMVNGFQAIDGHLQANSNRLQAIDDCLGRIEARLNGIDGQHQATEGRMHAILGDTSDVGNMQRRAVNRHIVMRLNGDTGEQHPLTPLLTRHGQYGNGFAGMARFDPPVGLPPGEEIPCPPFPVSLAAIDVMTPQQIHVLAVYANDDFGIVLGDTLQEWRKKVRAFVLGA